MQGSTIIPCLSYRDAAAAIAWLEQAFGLRTHARYDNPDGTVAHAELASGSGMLMLGTSKEPASQTPDTSGSLYLVVPDARQTFAAAQAAHATIVDPLEQKDYGGWAFNCRDLEGHLWAVGDYDPWA